MITIASHHGREIKAKLIVRGVSLSEIAKRCKVTPSAVSRVVARRATSRKIEGEVARLLGVARRELFPRLQWVAVRHVAAPRSTSEPSKAAKAA